MARTYAERGDVDYRAGKIRDSLSWLLRAYEVVPREDPLRRSYVRLIGSRGQSLSSLVLRHDGYVTAASFSPDGRTILTQSGKVVSLWDAETGRELHRLAHDNGVYEASFSPDGRTVLTIDKDDFADGGGLAAHLWDAASGRELQRLPHEARVQAASFSPDGRMVLTASDDQTARLWDARSGKELHRLAREGKVFEARFSPDGHTVLTWCRGSKTTRLWDTAGGVELQRLTHEHDVWTAKFSPDGRMVLTINWRAKGSRCNREPAPHLHSTPSTFGTPPAARSCTGSSTTRALGGHPSAPTGAPFSPPADGPPGSGTPSAGRSCAGFRIRAAWATCRLAPTAATY